MAGSAFPSSSSVSLYVLVRCITKLLDVRRLGMALAAVLLVALKHSVWLTTATRGPHAALAPADPSMAGCMEGFLRAMALA